MPATLVWIGDVSGSWGANVSGNTNWVNSTTNTDNVLPHDNDDLLFPALAGNHTNTNNLSGLSIHSITFGGTDYVVGGNAITLTSSLSDTSSSGSNALNLPITLTGTLAASVSATSTRLTLGGVISGSGGLTKSGGGVLRLSGSAANTYTGLTTVNAGTLELNKSVNVLPLAGNLTINGGTVRVLAGGQFLSTSAVTVNTGGTFDISFGGQGIGALTVSGGSVTVGTGSTLAAGPVTMTGGSIASTGVGKLQLVGDVTTNAASAPATISGTLDFSGSDRTFTVADGPAAIDLDIPAVITGSGSAALKKFGPGTLRLEGSASNTYPGTTFVFAGTLEFDKIASGTIAVAVPGKLEVDGGTARELADNQIADTSIVTVNSGGTLDLGALGTSDTIGPLTVGGGSVTIGTGTLAAGPVTMTGGSIISTGAGKLLLQGNVTTNVASAVATLSGNLDLGGLTRIFTVADGTAAPDLDIAAAVSNGSVQKNGPGTLRLDGSAANTYTGTTTVAAGTLELAKTGGTVAVPGDVQIVHGVARELAANQIADASNVDLGNADATFDLNNFADTIGGVTTFGTVAIGTGTLSTASVDMTGGSIASTGAGKLVLRGNVNTNAASGPATISGNLDLGAATRTITVADGPTVNPDLDISAAISNGGLTKSGGGTLRIDGSASNTYAGLTTVSAGTLDLGKTGGATAIGAAAQDVNLTINGGTVRESGSNQIADTSKVTVDAGGTFDLNNLTDEISTLIVFGGSVTIGTGTLTPKGVNMTGGSITSTGAGKLVLESNVFTTAAATSATISGNLDLNDSAIAFVVGDEPSVSPDLDISAAISNGGLVKAGDGTLRLEGSASNTYTGTTTVNAGTLELAKNGGAVTALAVRDLLLSGGSAREIFSNQVADTSRVTVNSGAKFDLNGQADTIGPLSVAGGSVTIGTGALTAGPVTMTGGGISSTGLGRLVLLGNVTTNEASSIAGQVAGRLDLGGATRTVDVGETTSGADLRFSGPISGTGSEGLIKTGPGDLVLEGFVSNTYTGPTTVSAGTLRLLSDGTAVPGDLTISGGTVREDGINQIADTSTVTVNSGGTFNVNGLTDTIGPLTVAGGTLTTIAPSASRLTAGNTSFDAAATLKMKLFGATNSDRITVNGTLAVGGTLQLSLSSPVAVGTTITLIDNDGTDPVTGTFNGLPPGAVLTVGGQTFTISYAGGDGNDVTVTASSVTAPAVTVQPANQTVGEGNPVTFTASASGIPTPTVQWQVSTNGGATFADVPGATGMSLTFDAALSQSGNRFRAVFSNSSGTATTNAATLTVIGKPTAVGFGLAVSQGTPTPLTLLGSDPANRPLTFVVTAPPQHGTLSGTAPNLTYTSAAGYVGPDGLQYKVNNGILDSNPASVFIAVTAPGTAVQAITADNGTAQRSMVRSLTVTFSGVVTFAGPAANAFQLVRTGGGNVTLAVDLSGSTPAQTVARLTFSGPLTEGANSLVDGNYTLTVLSSQVQGGLQGGDNISTLFRLFGDVNGDKAVNGLDLAELRKAFGTTSADPSFVAAFDFSGDGAINGSDLTQFRSRFGVILP